jgi:hypothetical protein
MQGDEETTLSLSDKNEKDDYEDDKPPSPLTLKAM